jgi:hypothetical protein
VVYDKDDKYVAASAEVAFAAFTNLIAVVSR